MSADDPTPLKDIVDIIQGSVTTLAILAGGLWGYVKVIRGRLYRPRLEPSVSGRLVALGSAPYAIVKLSVKNVGLSRVRLDKDLSTLEIEAYSTGSNMGRFHRAFTDKLGLVGVLRTHEWVEPGECIVDEETVALPGQELFGLLLKFRLVQAGTWYRKPKRSIEWNAVAVAESPIDACAQQSSTQQFSEENDHGPTARTCGAAEPGRDGVRTDPRGVAAPAGTGGGTSAPPG